MTKKPSLAAAMEEHDLRASAATVIPPPIAELPARRSVPTRQPGRGGKKSVMGYFSPECKKQLKLLLAEQGKTEQDILAEALNDLFTKYGKPTLA
jgi:hypothetical protein